MNLDKIKEYIPLLTFTSVIGTVIGGVYYFGGFMESVKEGQLTPTEKVIVIDHVQTSPNDVDMYKATKTLDSIAKLSKEEVKANIHRDSLRDEEVKKNSVTIFQLKTLMEKMVEQQEHFIEDAHRNNQQ